MEKHFQLLFGFGFAFLIVILGSCNLEKNIISYKLQYNFIEMAKKGDIPNQSLQIPKIITLTAKLLQAISPKLVTLFAAKLFTTPLKYRNPRQLR